MTSALVGLAMLSILTADPLPPGAILVPSMKRGHTTPEIMTLKQRVASLQEPARSHVRRMAPSKQVQFLKELCGNEDCITACGCTPLVAVFGDAPVEFLQSTVQFTFGSKVIRTHFPAPVTPWIAMDINRDGVVESATELFGSATVVSGGKTAAHGFQALSELDSNRDGRIDAQDAAFGSLLLWSDFDNNGKSAPEELTALSARVESISLTYSSETECDQALNCQRERSTMKWIDAEGHVRNGAVVDVYLRDLSRVISLSAR